MKLCKNCNTHKVFEEFYINKDSNRYSTSCKLCTIQKSKINQINNKIHRKIYLQEYSKINKVELDIKKKIRLAKNIEHSRAYYRQYNINKRANSPIEKIKHNMRNRLWGALKAKSWVKGGGTEKLLGCDYEFFKTYIENLFVNGMSWVNYGKNGWELDHKIPLDFANSLQELEELFHYTNTQPMWAIDNQRKKNKLNYKQQIIYLQNGNKVRTR